ERTETLLIEGAVHHEPISWIRTCQHRLRDRDECLRGGTRGECTYGCECSHHRHRDAGSEIHVFLPVTYWITYARFSGTIAKWSDGAVAPAYIFGIGYSFRVDGLIKR